MVGVTMIHILLIAMGILLVILAAAALAMLRALKNIAFTLCAMDGELITADEIGTLMAMPRPPNKTNPQARADGFTSPLVRRAADKLTQRRNEATNG